MPEELGLYARASAKVEEVLTRFEGQEFSREEFYRECGILNRPEDRPYRDEVSKVLYNISDQNKGNSRLLKPVLAKKGRNHYLKIEYDMSIIKWVDADVNDTFKVIHPMGRDGTTFHWQEKVRIYPQDLIVVAGLGNIGKTTLALNYLKDNMDLHKCFYYSSEFVAQKFKARLEHFNDVQFIKEDSSPKFTLVEWKQNNPYIIEPDALNIIDWVYVKDEQFWEMRKILEGIRNRLRKGIAIIAIQKTAGKEMGEGGVYSSQLVSFYMSIDKLDEYYRQMKIMKCKDAGDTFLDGKRYRFQIAEYGSYLQAIQEIKSCKGCKGTGYRGGGKCSECEGVGYKTIEDLPNEYDELDGAIEVPQEEIP